jgi:hypothetical protein
VRAEQAGAIAARVAALAPDAIVMPLAPEPSGVLVKAR